MSLGRQEEAADEARKALELDPFSVTTCQILGTVYLYSGRYEDAIELFERALEIEKANEIERSNASSMNDLAYAYAKA